MFFLPIAERNKLLKYTFGTDNRNGRYVRKIVTYAADGSEISKNSIRDSLRFFGVDFRNINMLAISFKGPPENYEECAEKQHQLLERISWSRLSRYIQLDGHAEWIEDGNWLVYWN